VSGPARSERQRAQRRTAGEQRALVHAVPAALAWLAGHRLIDRLIAGKAWIGIVAFALIGIVTLQLALLGLNTHIGRALERESALQRQNAALSIENSEMAAGNRVESRAAQLGMELVPAGSLRFLGSHPHSDPAKAASALSSAHPASAGSEPSSPGASAQRPSSSEAGAEASTASSQASTGSAEAPGASSAAAAGSSESEASSSTSSAASPQAGAPQSSAAAPAPSGGQVPEASGAGTTAGGTQPGATG